MRDWITLFEMPMASYNLHGNWNLDEPDPETPVSLDDETQQRPENSFVDRHDRRLVNNPRIQQRVGDLLMRFPVPIHVHLWNSRSALWFYDNLDYQKMDRDALNRLPNALRTIMTKRSPDEITVLLAHNEGGSSKHPLSPWMILHRIAHALDGIGGAQTMSQFTEVKDNIPRLYRNVETGEAPDKFNGAVAFLNQVCTFKAARENKVLLDAPSYGEGFTEMLVQFLIKGEVPFNAPPDSITVDGLEYKAIDRDRIMFRMKMFESWVNAHCRKVVDNAKGGAFIC